MCSLPALTILVISSGLTPAPLCLSCAEKPHIALNIHIHTHLTDVVSHTSRCSLTSAQSKGINHFPQHVCCSPGHGRPSQLPRELTCLVSSKTGGGLIFRHRFRLNVSTARDGVARICCGQSSFSVQKVVCLALIPQAFPTAFSLYSAFSGCCLFPLTPHFMWAA